MLYSTKYSYFIQYSVGISYDLWEYTCKMFGITLFLRGLTHEADNPLVYTSSA